MDSRISTAETSVNRLRAFLEQATTVTDIAALEGELSKREADLEAMKGQRRAVQEQVDLATITLHLQSVAAAPSPASAVEDLPGVGTALAAGIAAFWFVARVVLVGAAWSAPFVVALGVPALAVLLMVRRRRRRDQPPTVSTADV